MAKVASVSLDRLHNLGNYEHLKLSVRVDLNEGDDPGLIISRLEKLLSALKPITTDYDYQRALKVMSDPERAADETARNVEVYKKRIDDHDRAVARRARALELFAYLGGTSEHVDAKDKWEDDGFWDYDEGEY